MQRKHLEVAFEGIIKQHIEKASGLFAGDLPSDQADLLCADIVHAMVRNGAMETLGNLAESFALPEANRIGVRAQLVAYQVPADEDKPIVIKLEADNNTLTGVQLAMLRGASVDLSGCQGELFAASDLGIHLAPQMDFEEVA